MAPLHQSHHSSLTPMFAKIDKMKSKKWTQSSKQLASNVIVEELCHRSQQNKILKKENSEIYSKICQKCSTVHFLCIQKMIAMLYASKPIRKWQTTTHQKLPGYSTGTWTQMNTSRTFLLTIFLSSTNLFSVAVCNFPFLNLTFLPSTSRQHLRKLFGNINPCFPKKELATATLHSIALNYIER